MASSFACVAVIPAHGAEKTIERTIRALREESKGFLDRIVVVASPADRTAEVAERLGATVIRTPVRMTAGAARNLGRDLVRDIDLVLFVDADCAPGSGALRVLSDTMRRDGLDAVGASVVSVPRGTIAWARHALEFKDAEPGALPNPASFVPSATFLCRTDVFDAVGGFPDLWPGEDLVLCARLARHGYRVRRAHDATTLHVHPPGFGAMLRHQLALGRTSAHARELEDIPGRVFVDHPYLIPFLFVARAARMVAWARRTSHLQWLLSPRRMLVYGTGLLAWCAGFAQQARTRSR